jgi:Reverse transcriptase (RNA-dependent DNA polymerase)
MDYMNNGVNIEKKQVNHQFVQTYSLMKGMKHFGNKGKEAAMNEMKQLHERNVFEPVRIEDLNNNERKRAMESLIFLVEKRDGTVKGRACANGSVQRPYIDKGDATSPTVSTEAVLNTSVLEAKQNRDVMTADTPNAFVQTEVDNKKFGERIIMKIRGPLVDMLVEIAPEAYTDYVREDNGKKVVYVKMLKASYGMLQSAIFYYKKFKADIEEIGFKINEYDPCVANRMVNNKHHTIVWHVDDVKSSHINSRVNDEFLKWLQMKYGSDNIGKVKATRGKVHDYLAMKLDYSEAGILKVDMTDYVKSMIQEFPQELNGKVKSPWNTNLFHVDPKSKLLDETRSTVFHTFIMKGMFLAKRGRQDIMTGIAYLSTKVTNSSENDWWKLKRLMIYLKREYSK